jgi:hypothetical protein
VLSDLDDMQSAIVVERASLEQGCVDPVGALVSDAGPVGAPLSPTEGGENALMRRVDVCHEFPFQSLDGIGFPQTRKSRQSLKKNSTAPCPTAAPPKKQPHP